MSPSRLLLAAVLVSSCSTPVAEPDASPADAASSDAGAMADAGTTDAANDDGDVHGDAGGDAGRAARGATLVPLYSYPTDDAWTDIVTAHAAHPSVRVVAVVNPSNGPTPTAEPTFASHIPTLASAGIEVVGYVATGYASRDAATVASEIDLYAAQYPDVTGIFFDEVQATEAGHEAYYQGLVAHAHDAGFAFTAGNPGTDILLSYDGVFDVILVYESDGAPAVSSLSRYAGRTPSHFAIIPYAVASVDATYVADVTGTVGWVYLTDDDLPNPWDTLPSYFADLLAALE